MSYDPLDQAIEAVQELETTISQLLSGIERAMRLSGHDVGDPDCAACGMWGVLNKTISEYYTNNTQEAGK